MASDKSSGYNDHLNGGSSRPSSNPSARINMEPVNANYALSTREALVRLHKDIEQEVIFMKDEFSKRSFFSWLKESVSFGSELSKMRWPSVIFMTAQAIVHFVVAFLLEVDNLAVQWVGVQGILLSILLVINLAVNLWDTKLRFQELLMKSEQILDLIKRCSHDKLLLQEWKKYSLNSSQAKTLFIPKSPCIHQTITYRDDSCLNLPDYLLVKGDIIHLFPGEKAPGDCVSLRTFSDHRHKNTQYIGDKLYLEEGQIFHTNKQKSGEDLNLNEDCDSDQDEKIIMMAHAKLKKANKGTNFLMLSTPYLKSLRISLQRSHKRPVNSVEKECFIVSRKYFETFVVPSVFVLSTIVTAIHYGYLDLTDSDQKIKTISIAYLLLRPSLTIMPFLPWMFPCFWLVVNAYGSARLLCCAEAQQNQPYLKQSSENDCSPGWSQGASNRAQNKFTNLLATPTAAGSSEQNKHDEELQDLSSNIKFTSIFKKFIDLVRGRGGYVWRSSSLLQVLGCLTSLCCIDKVGILSWSNPTPEKVFVLSKNRDYDGSRNNFNPTASHSEENSIQNPIADSSNQQTLMSMAGEALNNQLTSFIKRFNEDQVSNSQIIFQGKHAICNGHPEVLDVSQTFNLYQGLNEQLGMEQPHKIQFDDLNWRRYIDNLKPLGLAIMMNNCCEKSFGDYFRFYKHISYESILRCNLTPVVKRRCICSVARLIGFTKESMADYKYVNQIGAYKLIDPRTIKKGKLVSSIESTTRLKLPFSNMTCNIHQSASTGSYQIFSQGTADIILDACVEFWDGKQLSPLDEGSRKKIMDFYHRTSLTSYCFAFSYTPILNEHDLGNHYIELPSENSKFSPQLRKLANEHQEEFLQNQLIRIPAQKNSLNKQSESQLSSQMNSLSSTPIIPAGSFFPINDNTDEVTTITRRHLSYEDLYGHTEESRRSNRHIKSAEKKSRKHRELNDVLDELTDQVFVGMVAMQYQACPDFVALVEQLEHACIRFIHFSKENELRSRVFSEKMGLESGWNCHISLQSDQDLDNAEKNNVESLKTVQSETTRRQLNDDSLGTRIFTLPARVSNILFGRQSIQKADLNKTESTELNDVTCYDGRSISSDERTLYSWQSLPSLVMHLLTKVSSPNKHQSLQPDQVHNLRFESSGDGHSDLPTSEYDEENEQNGHGNIAENATKDEGFESLAFDMSNRAKLPKGIENIRPHLETVDNIPLQVSLFTDCTPELTKEMIEIMQEYGEIVCVIGSASSRLNTPVFLQANASIAIEPLMPMSCTRKEEKEVSHRKKKQKRELKRKRRFTRHIGAVKKVKNKNGEVEYSAIQMQPTRLNKPRDRLGIGPPETLQTQQMRSKQYKQDSSSESSEQQSISDTSSIEYNSRRSSTSSVSCSSTPSSASSSSSSSSGSEDDLIENFKARENLNNDTEKGKIEDIITSSLLQELPDPNSLATKLASLPCSYSYNRSNSVNLYSLIMEARHFTFKMKNTFVCMICFALSISSAQFLASILFLPPMLSSGLTIWLTVVVVPLMSFSLMNTTMDSQVMKIAVGKNLQLKPENITFFVICYLIKFIPSIIVVVLSFGLIIAHSCKLTGFGSSSLGPCWMFTYVQHGNATSQETGDEDLLWSSHLLTAQVCAGFLLVLYFVVISSGFVHRSHLMWQRSPTSNHFWSVTSLALIIGQLLYNHLLLQVNLNSSKIPYEFLSSLPPHIWLISFIWPVLVIAINLLVKRAEIKATIRQQRRARFDFNTKLGMNSPF